MERVLLVGDVHATPEELGDCEALMGLVLDTAIKEQVTRVVLLGDNYHTHAVVRLEVVAFWREIFTHFHAARVPVTALVGNHDFGGEGTRIHAMMAHERVVEVIDRPKVHGGVLYMPYYSDREAFVRDAAVPGTSTLVCHQTFAGAKYDNAFYAPDGVDPNLVPQAQVLSGHIHTPQKFGKVTYIGAPRWRTLSDANIERAICLYEFDDAGQVVSCEPFDTGVACRQIRSATDTPEAPLGLPLSPDVDWRVDVRGPASWVDERKAVLAGPGVRLRTFVTKDALPAVRESEGINIAFERYLATYVPRYGTSPEILKAMAEDRLHVQ